MRLKELVACMTLLAHWEAASSTEAPPIYQVLSVQVLDSDIQPLDSSDTFDNNQILDVFSALLPDINAFFKDFKENATDKTIRQAFRLKEIVELFIPLLKNLYEFLAEDDDRPVPQEFYDLLDNAEIAVAYLSSLAEATAISDNASDDLFLDDADFSLPDYTELLQETEKEFSDVSFSEFNSPWVLNAYEKDSSLSESQELRYSEHQFQGREAPSPTAQIQVRGSAVDTNIIRNVRKTSVPSPVPFNRVATTSTRKRPTTLRATTDVYETNTESVTSPPLRTTNPTKTSIPTATTRPKPIMTTLLRNPVTVLPKTTTKSTAETSASATRLTKKTPVTTTRLKTDTNAQTNRQTNSPRMLSFPQANKTVLQRPENIKSSYLEGNFRSLPRQSGATPSRILRREMKDTHYVQVRDRDNPALTLHTLPGNGFTFMKWE
ncbi:uncharacterized protein [Panulirus ornatus]|uniref:uncharacterized protein n=1 Tax=Panulirus ornatus TaxID=150431 RepID=UPI003A899245